MTVDEPRADREQKPVEIARKGALLQRVRDWFWRGSELSKVRTALPEPNARALAYAQRAQTSAELARSMFEPVEPGELEVEGNACESYRQASYWSLCALLAQAEPALSLDDSERIWSTLDETLLAQAAASEPRIAGLRSALRSGSFVYFAELPAAEQAALLPELRKLAQALLAKLAERSVALDAVYLQRVWRMALLGLVALGLAMAPSAVKQAVAAHFELSSGKPWRTSSTLSGVSGCTSPAQQCTESSGFFFHTNEEESPWIEFDLGKSEKISKVVVENRSDCCADRATPLIIEVSADQNHWRTVARHDGEFSTWEASFAPVSGRYLRARLLRQSYLHLAAVHIY